MKKQALAAICVLSATVGVLLGLVLYRKSHPVNAALAPPKGSVPATESNPLYVAMEATWLKKRFEEFPSGSSFTKLAEMRIDGGPKENASLDKDALLTSVDRVMRSFKATSFEDFVSSRTDGLSFRLDPDRVADCRSILTRFHLKAGEKLPKDNLGVLKLFWAKQTNQGQLQSYWDQICWDDSWIRIDSVTEASSIADEKALVSSIVKNFQNCGVISYRSIIQYVPSCKQVLSADGTVYVSFCHILIKNAEGKAYPLIIQSYWAPSIRVWLPSHIAIGFLGPRKLDPVF